jgi:hypothetical protein
MVFQTFQDSSLLVNLERSDLMDFPIGSSFHQAIQWPRKLQVPQTRETKED